MRATVWLALAESGLTQPSTLSPPVAARLVDEATVTRPVPPKPVAVSASELIAPGWPSANPPE